MPKPAIDITPADSAVPVFLIEPTDAEIAERQAQHEAQEEAKAARETVRTSALAKLAALGLTEEELATLSV
jgi:flagellar motor switch protein FliM